MAVQPAPVEPDAASALTRGLGPALLGWLGGWREPLFAVFREQAWFIGLVLAYLAAGFAVGRAYGHEISLWLYNDAHVALYLGFTVGLVSVRIVRVCLRHRPEHPLSFVWADLSGDYLCPRRLLSAVPALVLLPLALSMTTSLKKTIPLIEPFYLDSSLARIDRALHGGYHPWELLQPMLGEPAVTYALSLAYSLPWYVVVIALQFWATFTLDRRRMRVLLAYVLCWAVLGSGLATAFSSAGPCYFGEVVDGANPYAPLMAYLDEVARIYPLPSAMAQEYLWTSYQEDFLRLGNGISAMPSLHISMAFLVLLAARQWHRTAALLAGAYLLVLLVGSVHLGWHYAIDGYAAMLATGAIWWALGRPWSRPAAEPRQSIGAY